MDSYQWVDRIVRSCVAVAALAIVVPNTAAQAVIVVNAHGAGDYQDLAAAVDAASDGDIVVLESLAPTNDRTTIVGKGLTLVGTSTAPVSIGPLTIRSLPSTSTMVVRNVEVVSSDGVAVEVVGAAGSVVLEQVVAEGAAGGLTEDQLAVYASSPALVLRAADDVSVIRSSFLGGLGAGGTGGFLPVGPGRGADAAYIEDSTVSFEGCDFLGGDGGPGTLGAPSGAFAGSGLFFTSSQGFLSGCTATSGVEPGLGSFCKVLLDLCGAGMKLDQGTVQFIDTQFVLSAGAATYVAEGVLEDLGASARLLDASAPVTQGQPGVINYQGVAGDQVALLLAPNLNSTPVPGLKGVLHIAAPVIEPVVLGTTNGDGELTLSFVGPDLGVLGEGLTFFAQSIALTTNGDLRAGGTSALILIDS